MLRASAKVTKKGYFAFVLIGFSMATLEILKGRIILFPSFCSEGVTLCCLSACAGSVFPVLSHEAETMTVSLCAQPCTSTFYAETDGTVQP